MKKHNFSAGPSILPASVMKKASEAVIEFNGIGLSLIEISHRSKSFVDVIPIKSEVTSFPAFLNVPDATKLAV